MDRGWALQTNKMQKGVGVFLVHKKMVELLSAVELERDGIGFWDPGEEKQGEDGFYVAGAYAIEGMSLPEP